MSHGLSAPEGKADIHSDDFADAVHEHTAWNAISSRYFLRRFASHAHLASAKLAAMEPDRTDHVASLTWDAIAARLDTGAAAILPIGAGAKEHGLHLPMNTDQIQAEWLARIIAQEVDALIWPTMTYGHYPAFVHYAGSISLSAATFKKVLSEILTGIARFNPQTILVVDTGISTLRPVAETLGAADHYGRAVHLKVHDGPRYAQAVAQVCEQAGGSHADEAETARMLALAAELVTMERAEASPPGKGGVAGPLTPFDPASANYAPSGSWGDPTLATPEKGEALLEAMAKDVIEMARRAVAGKVTRV